MRQAYVGLGNVREIARSRFESRSPCREPARWTWVRECIPGKGKSTTKGPERKQLGKLQEQK